MLNRELLTTVVDMLAVLINGTLAHDNSDKTEEGKKFYQNLMRKLKVVVSVSWLAPQDLVGGAT